MNLALWLELLLGLFALRVDPERDPADPDPQPDPEPDQPELDLDPADPEPEPRGDPEPDAAAQLAEEKKQRQAAEARNQDYERRMAEAQRAQAPSRSKEEELRATEDAKLRDPKTTDLERWQIDSNRTLRANNAASSAALAQANDVSDSTRFSQLAVTKPGIYNRYKDRVEAELAKMRSRGESAPREAILRFLIGNDAIDGKLTRKKAAARAEDAPASPRGGRLPPGARTDVQGGKGMSEREKRAKRLENTPI